MPLGKTSTIALSGIQAGFVRVEANSGPGLPGTYIVGLADAAVSESRDRIKTAVRNQHLNWPKSKIIVNLSPASVRKTGAQSDLAIAVAILVAQTTKEEVRHRAETTLFLCEIALDGSLLPVTGILPALLAAQKVFDAVIIPRGNEAEAGLIDAPKVFLGDCLKQVWQWILTGKPLPEAGKQLAEKSSQDLDMREVTGQPEAKLATEVAAAGGHHILMVGPPGSGKSMIAARLPGILPPLTLQERIETTVVHSVAGKTMTGTIHAAPFIAPHHSVTKTELLGGGAGTPQPGAISLAHHGVLFLDEASEIPAAILDQLRDPLETGRVRINRSRYDVTFPARFQLILATNLCRCGAETVQKCRCGGRARATYLHNLSGPLRDRLYLIVKTKSTGAKVDCYQEESSAVIAQRVSEARLRAARRWQLSGYQCGLNARVNSQKLRRYHPADDEAMAYVAAFLANGSISQRGLDRALKVAWTLCDLAGAVQPNLDDIAAALDLRTMTYEPVTV